MRQTIRISGGLVAIATALALGGVGTAHATPASTSPAKAKTHKTIAMVEAGKARLKVGDSGGAIGSVQRRLNNVGIATPVTGTYSAATSRSVEHFQWKFFLDESGEVNRHTLARLKDLTKHGAHIPNYCLHQKKIMCADKSQKVLRYFKKGKLVRVLDARFGAPGVGTREGNFHVTHKIYDGISSLYGTPMPRAMYFSGGQAVHFSKYFKADGYNGASHGCVNLRDWKGVNWLYRQIPVGTPVKVYH